MKKLYIPPVLILYSFVAFAMFYFLMPKFNMILFPVNLLGIVIAFFGFILMGKTKELFKKYDTTLTIDKSSHLITEGVFLRTRNPMYCGMFLLILGIGIFSTNLISLLIPFVFLFLVSTLFIRQEEKLMYEAFGQEYLQYKNRIRRWL